MPRYTVYYRKTIPEDPVDTADLFIEPDYYNMGEFEASSLDELFSKMQGEVVSGEFIDKCAALRVHTSMCTGDVAQDEHSNYWIARFAGWERIPPL